MVVRPSFPFTRVSSKGSTPVVPLGYSQRGALLVQVEERLDAGRDSGGLGQRQRFAGEDARRVNGHRIVRRPRVLHVPFIREVIAELGDEQVHLALVDLPAVADLATAVEGLARHLVARRLRADVARVVGREEAIVAPLGEPVVVGLDVRAADAGDRVRGRRTVMSSDARARPRSTARRPRPRRWPACCFLPCATRSRRRRCPSSGRSRRS